MATVSITPNRYTAGEIYDRLQKAVANPLEYGLSPDEQMLYGRAWQQNPGLADPDAFMAFINSMGGPQAFGVNPQQSWEGTAFNNSKYADTLGADWGQFNQAGSLSWEQDEGSLLGDAWESFSPLAVMAGAAFGGNALFGPGGLFSGAGATSAADWAAAVDAGDAALGADMLNLSGTAGAGAGGWAAGADAADAVIGQDMLNLAKTQGVDLSSLWNSNTFGAAGGLMSSLGTKGLLSGAGDLLSGLGSGLGSLVGGGGDLASKAAASLPILAAINYAKNQGPFDTSRFESTYNEFQPESLAYEYDQNTARGRDALTSSLSQRGVMGSSFGNNDITNFQTSRDLGRRSLVNQGLAARANIAAPILDAEIKGRALKNDLYGRSLLALGNVFGGGRR
jgi:hypothetical protein